MCAHVANATDHSTSNVSFLTSAIIPSKLRGIMYVMFSCWADCITTQAVDSSERILWFDQP